MTHDPAHDLAGIGPATLRLLTIAAAGAHHLLLVGPPATAPALLARRCRGARSGRAPGGRSRWNATRARA